VNVKKIVAVAFLGFGLVLGGCARGEKYGVLDAKAPAVQVKDVLLSDAYGGKDVRMSGTIAMQCASTGCWFFLDDGTGRMLVDLKGLGLGLPQRGGRKALVSGTVTVDQYGQAVLTATGLEVS
jgi:hypothetical protein